MTCAVGAIQNFIIEDGEVECKSEADRVRRWKIRRGDLRGALVGVEGGRGGGLPGIALLELGEVAMVVALHLIVENLCLLGGGIGDEALLDDAEDVVADIAELVFDLDLVILDDGHFVGVALLLDGGHHSPTCPSRSNDVLVGDREEISLLHGEFLRLTGDFFHVADHFIEPLGLFGELCLVNEGIAIHGGWFVFVGVELGIMDRAFFSGRYLSKSTTIIVPIVTKYSCVWKFCHARGSWHETAQFIF